MEDDDVQVSSDDESPSSAPAAAAGASIDPTDPDAVLGKPSRFWVWLAPDWSDYADSQKDKTWTRVQVEETRYQDGRVITRVLDANNRPIMHQNLEERVDTKQQDRFKKAKKDAEARKPTPPTRNILMPDGTVHIMERNPETGEYDIDRGLAPNQPPKKEEKPKPSEATKWQPLRTPDGKVVALVDPATGDTVPVTQKDPAKPHIFETKDGRIITVDPEGRTATDVTPEKPGDKPISDKAPRYVPDYTKPDGGLTDYNERLKEAHRAGIIDRPTALRLIQEASALWETTATHGGKLTDQARSIYSDQIGQRRDTLAEVRDRRSTAAGLERDVRSSVDKLADDLMEGSGATGQTVVDAYRAMLRQGQRTIENMGGMQEVPDVEMPPSLQAIRNIRLSPDGSIEIQAPTGGAPAAAPAAAPAVKEPGPANMSPNPPDLSEPIPPVNPLPGEPGHDPTKPVGMAPAGGQDDEPQMARLRALGLDDDDARNVLALHKRGVRADQL